MNGRLPGAQIHHGMAQLGEPAVAGLETRRHGGIERIDQFAFRLRAGGGGAAPDEMHTAFVGEGRAQERDRFVRRGCR